MSELGTEARSAGNAAITALRKDLADAEQKMRTGNTTLLSSTRKWPLSSTRA